MTPNQVVSALETTSPWLVLAVAAIALWYLRGDAAKTTVSQYGPPIAVSALKWVALAVGGFILGRRLLAPTWLTLQQQLANMVPG